MEDLVIHPVKRFPNPNLAYQNIDEKKKERLHEKSQAELKSK